MEFQKVEEAFAAIQQVKRMRWSTMFLSCSTMRLTRGKERFRSSAQFSARRITVFSFLPTGSYRKPVDEALLKIKENGTYEQLYRKWFGGNSS